jgi:hypothetical protein
MSAALSLEQQTILKMERAAKLPRAFDAFSVLLFRRKDG